MRISYPSPLRRRSVLFAVLYLVRSFVENSVSGLYSEEMRSSRVRALEWRSQSSCEEQGNHDLRLIFVNSWNPPTTILNNANVKAA